MASNLKIPSPLRRFTNDESSINVNGKNIRDILNELFGLYPEIKNMYKKVINLIIYLFFMGIADGAGS